MPAGARREMNAIFVPSADHTGKRSVWSVVSWVSPDPSGLTDQMSDESCGRARSLENTTLPLNGGFGFWIGCQSGRSTIRMFETIVWAAEPSAFMIARL